MSLISRIASRYPMTTISRDDGHPYMDRYFVYPSAEVRANYRQAGADFPHGAMLHHIQSSDPDQALHNHPWQWSYSVILSGSYLEERLDGRGKHGIQTSLKRFSRGMVNKIMANDFHRLILPFNSKGVWTLFIHGPRTQHWGFLDRDGEFSQYTGPSTAEQAGL